VGPAASRWQYDYNELIQLGNRELAEAKEADFGPPFRAWPFGLAKTNEIRRFRG
jgi:hypothetical protein